MDFFAEKAQEDCYLAAHGYKTYAHLFYGQPQGPGEACFKDTACMNRLFQKPLDKPAYIVTKLHRAKTLEEMETLEEVGRKNGFVFFKRKALLPPG